MQKPSLFPHCIRLTTDYVHFSRCGSAPAIATLAGDWPSWNDLTSTVFKPLASLVSAKPSGASPSTKSPAAQAHDRLFISACAICTLGICDMRITQHFYCNTRKA